MGEKTVAEAAEEEEIVVSTGDDGEVKIWGSISMMVGQGYEV